MNKKEFKIMFPYTYGSIKKLLPVRAFFLWHNSPSQLQLLYFDLIYSGTQCLCTWYMSKFNFKIQFQTVLTLKKIIIGRKISYQTIHKTEKIKHFKIYMVFTSNKHYMAFGFWFLDWRSLSFIWESFSCIEFLATAGKPLNM